VYFYLFGGLITVSFSIPITLRIYANPFISLSGFSILTLILTYVSLKLKLYLLHRIAEREGAYTGPQGSSDSNGRRFLLIVFLIVSALLVPTIFFTLLEVSLWFLGLVCFVAGFCLSEPILYVRYRKK
jgi:hypothetical protein